MNDQRRCLSTSLVWRASSGQGIVGKVSETNLVKSTCEVLCGLVGNAAADVSNKLEPNGYDNANKPQWLPSTKYCLTNRSSTVEDFWTGFFPTQLASLVGEKPQPFWDLFTQFHGVEKLLYNQKYPPCSQTSNNNTHKNIVFLPHHHFSTSGEEMAQLDS